MEREEWRYVWITAVGAALGFGWWSAFQAATSGCDGTLPFCDLGWILVLPLVPVVSWLLPWPVLLWLGVEKPGVAAGIGSVVFSLTGWIVLMVSGLVIPVPLPLWLTTTLLGGLSYLIAARYTA
ncbi:hypothetical protein ACFFQW_25050 [Umezawaea endophytica]|uniref:Uncharacterized protein n=1 Tax=Umezawaea endophytica TaxID=1654476 RepID=A0A9X2VQ48_9PSEU|nr:hypothetical protein [Umezawaea endophytica]MCS7479393.1 hypothetical protein [Umezawaea endophytica]